jgi:rod shape-determining protein MreC
MYRRQVRRRRAVLALLVTASLVLLSAHFSEAESGPLHEIQRGVASVLSPLEEGASRALKPARDLINWFDETFEARGQNDELRAEVADLRQQLVRYEEAAGENDELRAALELEQETGIAAYQPVTARVIGRSPTIWWSTVKLDQGSGDGIRVDDPVLTGDGLVGRVTETTSGSSEVTLITDHRSAVAAKVLPDGPMGVLKPEVGDPDDLVLDYIEEDQEVEEGSELATAGSTSDDYPSYYPPGLPIGEVTEAEPGEQETYLTVHVDPYADLREFEYVQVLTAEEPQA